MNNSTFFLNTGQILQSSFVFTPRPRILGIVNSPTSIRLENSPRTHSLVECLRRSTKGTGATWEWSRYLFLVPLFRNEHAPTHFSIGSGKPANNLVNKLRKFPLKPPIYKPEQLGRFRPHTLMYHITPRIDICRYSNKLVFIPWSPDFKGNGRLPWP